MLSQIVKGEITVLARPSNKGRIFHLSNDRYLLIYLRDLVNFKAAASPEFYNCNSGLSYKIAFLFPLGITGQGYVAEVKSHSRSSNSFPSSPSPVMMPCSREHALVCLLQAFAKALGFPAEKERQLCVARNVRLYLP